jgi:DNA-binding transcriptional LysR family regulator
MDWNDLRYFLAACRHGSLAGAARELGCEYTTVGRRIAALESALDTTLFVRTPDGLTLTPSAQDLVPLAEQVERSANEITLRAAGHDQRAEGVVRVTCAEGFSAYIVSQLGELRALHPGLVVEILDDIRPLDLARNEADFAIRLVPSTQRDLISRTLCVMNWRMFASESYLARRGRPSAVHNLAGHDVIGFDERLANVPGAQWLAEHAKDATIVLRGNSMHAVLDAAAAGLGLAVVPHFLAARDGRLQQVADDVLGTRTLSLVVHADLKKVARVRATMDFFGAAILRDHARGAFG